MAFAAHSNDTTNMMKAHFVYTCYVNDKGVNEFKILKDRYGGFTSDSLLTESEFITRFKYNEMDDRMFKRFLKYLKENEPEYNV